MTPSLSWDSSRGLERLLLQETSVSDLLQFLSDRDATPWAELVGFIPVKVEREALAHNRADLLLQGAEGQIALLEIKVGHVFDTSQQQRYEALDGDPALYLVALNMDEQRLMTYMTDRWKFLSLTTVVEAWLQAEDSVARVFAQQIAFVFRAWEESIHAVFQPYEHENSRPISTVREKSLARVVTRRIAVDLRQRGRVTYAGVTSGGGLPLVQAWTPIRNGAEDRCFIAEVRWRQNHPVGELRFGVDFRPTPPHYEDEKLRRAAYDLAISMKEALEFEALHTCLCSVAPHLASSLRPKPRSRPEAKGDWEQIIQQGFKKTPRTNNKKLTRHQVRPAFYGDGALNFQAMAALDFTQINALDLLEVLDKTLIYLAECQPTEAS